MIKVNYNEKKYFHLFSEGTKHDVLFHDREEFRSGMNIVALAVLGTGIEILAFALMDNHFHFVIRSDEETAERFAAKLVQMYKLRRAKTSEGEIERIRWKMAHVDNKEYLETVIVYVLRNPIDSWDNVILYYPWSSADLYFMGEQRMELQKRSCLRVGDMEVVRVRKILGTRINVPPDWLITSYGTIWCGSFVNYLAVEQVFMHARHFLYRISFIKREDLVEIKRGVRRIGVTDLEAREKAKEYCLERYGHDRLGHLMSDQRRQLADDLYVKLGASDKQIMKILRVEIK